MLALYSLAPVVATRFTAVLASPSPTLNTTVLWSAVPCNSSLAVNVKVTTSPTIAKLASSASSSLLLTTVSISASSSSNATNGAVVSTVTSESAESVVVTLPYISVILIT